MLMRIFVMLILSFALGTIAMAQKASKDVEDAINAASNFMDWTPDSDFYPKENAKQAMENGKACIEKLDQAIAGGLSTSIQVETYKGKMTIAEARTMCVSVL